MGVAVGKIPLRRAAILLAAPLLLLAGGCGREVPTASPPAKSDPVAGLKTDARSAELLRRWLGSCYSPGRAGVRRATVAFRSIRDADFYREPIVDEGTFEFAAGDPLPEWDPADAAAILARWLDPEAFRKDYAAAAFAAEDLPDGGVRVAVSGEPETNVRAFLFAPDGSLAGEEVRVHLDRARRPRAERHPVMTTRDGRRLIAGWMAGFEVPDVGPSTSDVAIAWVSHGEFTVPGAYLWEVRGGGRSWSVTIRFSNWRVNDEVDG